MSLHGTYKTTTACMAQVRHPLRHQVKSLRAIRLLRHQFISLPPHCRRGGVSFLSRDERFLRHFLCAGGRKGAPCPCSSRQMGCCGLRALLTETKVENGTSQSKCETIANSSNGGVPRRVHKRVCTVEAFPFPFHQCFLVRMQHDSRNGSNL